MTEKKLSRRDAMKLLGAAIGAAALANLPSKWDKPEALSGVLPAHARQSAVAVVTHGTQTFSASGAFIVPFGITSLIVDAYGAQGGDSFGSTGGLGGQATFTMTVTPGETLTIGVGGRGPNGVLGGTFGGSNGGGNSIGSGGGGGGWSGVSRGATQLVVAGGGGGGGEGIVAGGVGGAGGGTTGAAGFAIAGGAAGGGGGTQAAGGAGGAGSGMAGIAGTAGVAGTGGTGGDDGFIGGFAGGGGGGGYFGGGGGGGGPAAGAGGGGGSSYPAGATHLQGVHSGDGQVILTW